MAFEDDFFGFVPVAVFLCAGEIGAVVAVEILEDSILVFETAVGAFGRSCVLDGSVGSWVRA